MKTIVLMLLATAAFSAQSYDPYKTPGAVDLDVSTTSLCTVGYTKTVRNVSEATKREVCEKYQDPCKRGTVEIDHKISLELGGTNDVANLWPEDYCPLETGGKTCFGAREKDVVETTLHRRMCKGEITLQEAQNIINSDWLPCYHAIKTGGVCKN